jgi:DNA-binding SARP family transcriptional activator/streptogramin lyase
VLEFRILGPFEVVADDRSVPLGGNKQRALLAVLLLHRGEVVSSDRLIDELWGERAPATATKTLQVYVSNLRKVLGDGLLTTRGRGYEFAPAADQVDCDRFQRLAREGQDALQRGDPRAARVRLHDALELWRGPPLSDFSYEQFAQAEIARLEEVRRAVVEDRIEADLALGQGASLVPELEALAREHPLRERLHGHLMLALYRSGRQVDALERYHQARRMLDQFGIEPGPSLKDLEHRILNQDPVLRQTRSPPSPTVPRRLVPLLALAGLLLVAAAAAATLELAGGHGHSAALLRSRSDSVAMFSPTSGQQRASFPVGNNPSSVAVGAGAAWTANADDDTISRIDLVSHAERTYGTKGIPLDLAVGDGSLWILNGNAKPLLAPKSVSRLDPITSSLATIPLPKAPHNGPLPLYDMALGPQGVWVISGDTASRVDPDRNRVVQTIRNLKPLGIASGPEGTWVIEGGPNATVARLIPHSQKVAQRIGIRPRTLSGSIAIGAGAIWLTDPVAGELWRIDPTPTPVERSIRFAPGVSDVAYGAGALWVANPETRTLSRLDPRTNRITQTIQIGNIPGRLVIGGDGMWILITAADKVQSQPGQPTGATIAAHLKESGCLRAPVLWTAPRSHCVSVTGFPPP